MKDGERGGGENWDRGVERDDGRSEEMARLKNRQREREIEEEIEREIEGEQGGEAKKMNKIHQSNGICKNTANVLTMNYHNLA